MLQQEKKMTDTQPIKRRLTDNQRRKLMLAMERYDRMLLELIRSAKEVGKMHKAGEKMSQNADFKSKLLAYHHRFIAHLREQNLILPVYARAEEYALSNANQIVAGQSRRHVRHLIDRYRCELFHTMETDYLNVIYSCDGGAGEVR